jgi:hypothetical protein
MADEKEFWVAGERNYEGCIFLVKDGDVWKQIAAVSLLEEDGEDGRYKRTRLMVAAPMLLEIVREAEGLLYVEGYEELSKRARAVISKVTGVA